MIQEPRPAGMLDAGWSEVGQLEDKDGGNTNNEFCIHLINISKLTSLLQMHQSIGTPT